MRSIINPKYLDLQEFLTSLPSTFDSLSATSLKSGRNEVRFLTVNNHKIVIKSFRKFSPLNRVIYGTLRQSKAVRAYYHALRLQMLGIGTPEPIAAIDVRQRGVLTHSFYVYAYSEYCPMQELLDTYPDKALEPLLDALADFILDVHDKGVLHNDLNILNILYRDCGHGVYDFQMIDINRMEFHDKLSHHQRLTNLRRFNCNPAAFLYILERYAAAMNMDCQTTQLRGVGLRLIDTLKHEFKQRIKTLL